MSIHIQNVHNYVQIHIMVRIQCCYIHDIVHNYISFQTLTTQATALHIASRSNYLDIASQLLIAGAKLDLKDSDGKVDTCTVYCTVPVHSYSLILLGYPMNYFRVHALVADVEMHVHACACSNPTQGSSFFCLSH